MAHDTYLEERITRILEDEKADFYSKAMMGGRVFMVKEKMACFIYFDKNKEMNLMMARIGEDAAECNYEKSACHSMEFTGRPMKGYVIITPDGYDTEEDLEYWIKLCLVFNPQAKASKKKKKKQ